MQNCFKSQRKYDNIMNEILFFLPKADANELKRKRIEEFKNIEFFAATTDVWSRHNRSFLAMSVHFIDPDSFALKSSFIACDYFPGHHTHDRVAEKISSILDSYGIKDKVFFMTTDGAGEFTAAFKRFGDNYASYCFDNEEKAGDEVQTNENENDDYADAVELIFVSSKSNDPNAFIVNDIDEIIETATKRNLLGKINRIDCGAHKTDKLASIDSKQANDDHDYDVIYTQLFRKLNAIWKLKDSRVNEEHFKKITGRYVKRPHNIRWLKTFESVSKFCICNTQICVNQ